MNMRDAWHLYVCYVAASIRSQLQHRGSTIMLAIGQLVVTGVEFGTMWALFDRFGSLDGWSLPEVALLYGMANVAFALAEAFARGFDTFDQHVRTGELDRLLLRPRSVAFQVVASEVQIGRVGRMLQGALVLVYAASAIGPSWGAAEFVLLLASIAAGACIFSALFVLQATLSFWTIEGLEITNTVTYGGVETTQYPLSIYEGWLRNLFVFVIPLGCMGYFPALVLLDRPDPLGMPMWLPWASPVIGISFLLLALQIWRLGIRHYQSTGS
jgi:ABC-2 type transport system permease protein